MQQMFLLQILLLAQHVSGTIMPIIRSSRALYKWLLLVVFGALVFKLSEWCGAEGYVSGLRVAALQYRAVATDLRHPYWIYIIPTHDMHQWLLLQFLVLLMMDAGSVRNM